MRARKVNCTNCKDKSITRDQCRFCNGTKKARSYKHVLCNNCGDSLSFATNHHEYAYGLKECKVTGEYGSNHLTDLTRYTFNLCEKCIRVMFDSFKIKPKTEHMNITYKIVRGELSYEYNHEYFLNKKYSVYSGKGYEKYTNQICNVNDKCQNKALYSLINSESEVDRFCFCEEHKPNKSFIKRNNQKLISFVRRDLMDVFK